MAKFAIFVVNESSVASLVHKFEKGVHRHGFEVRLGGDWIPTPALLYGPASRVELGSFTPEERKQVAANLRALAESFDD